MNDYLKEMKKEEARKERPYLYAGLILGVAYFSLMYYLLIQFSRGMM